MKRCQKYRVVKVPIAGHEWTKCDRNKAKASSVCAVTVVSTYLKCLTITCVTCFRATINGCAAVAKTTYPLGLSPKL